MKKSQREELFVGTSNITLPGSRQTFPEEFRTQSRLRYYATLFNSLEINSSFYKVPQFKTFRRWTEEVPGDFKFTIKLWKELTHAKNLQYNLDHIAAFLSAADAVGTKKGCLLVQFPGSISNTFSSEVKDLLHEIQVCNTGIPWKIAVEFRNPGWYIPHTNELLEKYGAALVLHDIPKSRNWSANNANFVYIRFHGPAGDYRGSYNDELIRQQKENIVSWLKEGKQVYAYFNNTIGSAFENARQLYSSFGW